MLARMLSSLEPCSEESNSHTLWMLEVAKRDETIRLIFQRPTSSKVTFSDVRALLESLGGEYRTGKGSRRKFIIDIEDDRRILIMHEPHGGKEICKDAVDQVREILIELGMAPDFP